MSEVGPAFLTSPALTPVPTTDFIVSPDLI